MITFGLYSVISIFHYKNRKKFLLISLEPEKAEQQGYNLKLWDLLFYGSFGLVITSSVKIAGVPLVFSYLVVPSIIGMLFCSTVRGRLLVGWSVGFLASVLGLSLSYILDAPTGASLVVFFGITLVGAGIVRVLLDRYSSIKRKAGVTLKGIYLVLDSYEAIRRQKSKLQQNLRSGWPKIDYFLQLC